MSLSPAFLCGPILIFASLILLLSSCGVGSKRHRYERLMQEKGIELVANGPCAELVDDTLSEQHQVRIAHQLLTDTLVRVEFRVLEACCQEFLGDYTITNSVLEFTYEQVNDEACSCLCWYHYTLAVRQPGTAVSEVRIVNK